jgi:hypothetical protein
MEPLNDDEMRDLLRQWEVPPAPPHLEARIFGRPREPWFRWLLTGSVRVPVPALLLLVAVLSALTYLLPRERQAASPAYMQEVSFSDFQPVAELKPRIVGRTYESR